MNRPQGEWAAGLFLTCADINKHEMRKIIIISDRKTQRRTLIKKLNIHFRSKDEIARKGKGKKVRLVVDDFLPVGLNGEVVEAEKCEQGRVLNLEEEHSSCGVQNGVTSHGVRRECDSGDVYSTNLMRRKKMKKIVHDLFYNTLTYCIRRDLSVVEISTYLSIMKYIFFKLVNGGGHAVDLFAEFKKVMLHHSINRSPSYVKIFSYSSLRLLMKYALNTFFRNFFFYKFIFVPIHDIHFEGDVVHDLRKLDMDDEVGFEDDDEMCTVDTPSGADYVRRLLNLVHVSNCFTRNDDLSSRKHAQPFSSAVHVGEINHLIFGKSSEDAFIREVEDLFHKFEIQKEVVTFETNKCKENKNLKKLFKRMESCGQEDETGKNGQEKWNASEEYLIGKVRRMMDNLYHDLEARIVKRLDAHLG
ncbi:hypothetical protein AK88_02400 [Plasmodium fragile]|uniref:Uncharacterized protein n=1 Tax=Plasmodium fragile TaxID=5857 RepID=A0A0D9QQJ8_PLAFR|nr:uncharacterized protein AK88_02400 [Plasmodium fragile]KJP87966.1 hypothetical protein AK88_02400 [Plasmodium fragile]